MTDEEFLAVGKKANCFLMRLDVRFARLARREEELRKNKLPADVTAEELTRGYAIYDDMTS